MYYEAVYKLRTFRRIKRHRCRMFYRQPHGTSEKMCLEARVVVDERAVLPKDALGDNLGEGRPVDPELVLLADALIPATQQEAGVVYIVVEMMMREEKIVDFCRKEPRLHQFVGGSRAAIEHQVIAGDLNDLR